MEYTQSAQEEIPQSRELIKKLVKQCGEVFKLTGTFLQRTGKTLAEQSSHNGDDSLHELVDMSLAKATMKAGLDQHAKLSPFEGVIEDGQEETDEDSDGAEFVTDEDVPNTWKEKRKNIITSDTEDSSPGKKD